jgi:hypothetical protein
MCTEIYVLSDPRRQVPIERASAPVLCIVGLEDRLDHSYHTVHILWYYKYNKQGIMHLLKS